MSKTILCADDSATMQKVAEITFSASEYKYVGAKSADEAIEKAKAEKPALILADAVMPGKTGYDLCKAVKSDPDLAGIPVVLMCGNSQAYDAAQGEQAGADGHVVKPWDTQVMLDKVTEFVQKGASAQPAAAAAKPAAAAPAAKPAAPAAPPKPAAPAQPPRSATIMGMPAVSLPPKKEVPAGVTPIGPSAAPPAAAKPAQPAPPPASVPAVPPQPSQPAPSAPAAAGGERPPMITSQPKRGLRLVPINEVAAKVASEHGLDPAGPEMQALLKLSQEVVERIVWEVVPDLAEAIIRHNLDKLTAQARQ